MATIKIETDMNADAARALFAWGSAVADIIVNLPGDRKLRLGDLVPAGVHYMADYGGNKSMQDSVSGVAKAVKVAADDYTRSEKPDTKPWEKFIAESGVDPSTVPADDATIEMVTNAVIAKRQGKRFDAMAASSLAVRESGGRLSGRDAWIAKAALDEIKAKHDKAGKEMPKGAALKELVVKYAAAKADYFAKLWAEHNARLAGAAETADEILGF